MLEWLIVGGGIHGTHLYLVLRDAGVSESELRVLDPWERPMVRSTELTSRTGMTFLRSLGVHHIGLDPYDLLRFAGRRRARDGGYLRGRYRRAFPWSSSRRMREPVSRGRLWRAFGSEGGRLIYPGSPGAFGWRRIEGRWRPEG